jgi:putative heme iron utilization protein
MIDGDPACRLRSRPITAMHIPPALALSLLHRAPFATLATHSLNLPGYPHATAVPNVQDEQHCPILLLSELAEHSKNLQADPRVSLSVLDPDGAAELAPQTAARLTLTGDIERLPPEALDSPLCQRYLRYQPEAADYLALDFAFYRLRPRRLRYIGGVGRMGWLEAADWTALPALSSAEENEALVRLASHLPAGVTLLGLDPLGIDYHQHGQRRRFELEGPLDSALPGFLALLQEQP